VVTLARGLNVEITEDTLSIDLENGSHSHRSDKTAFFRRTSKADVLSHPKRELRIDYVF
jgi:hypothetical protein